MSSKLWAGSPGAELEAAERALQDGLPEITISRLSKADLNSFKDPNQASLVLAQAYLDSGEVHEAIKQLKQTALNSDLKSLLFSKAYYQQGNWQLGLDQLQKTTNSETELLRARFLVKLNRSSEAIVALEKSLNQSSSTSSPEAKLLLAQLYFQDGRTLAAEALLENSNQFPNPSQISAQLINAQIALEKKQLEKSLTLLAELLKREDLSAADKSTAKLLQVKCFIAQKSPAEAQTLLFTTFPKLERHDLLVHGLQLLQLIRKESKSTKALIAEAQTVIAEDRNQASAIYSPYLKLFLAELLSDSKNPQQLQEANDLVSNILNVENHPLREESYRVLGNIQMKQGRPNSATESFLSAKKNDNNTFQAAYASWMSGNWSQARELFKQVSQSSNEEFAQAAKSNLATLIAAEGEATPDSDTSKDATIQKSLLLEKAFKAVRENAPDAENLLNEFLEKAPEHPRTNEAKLALAQILIEQSPENAEITLKLLNEISPESNVDAYRLTNLKIRSYESLKQWENSIQTAQDFLKKNAESPKALLIRLKLAEGLFENGNYNKARLSFAEVSKDTSKDPKNSSIYEIAIFYEAVSALRVATPASKEDAVKLFKKVISLKGVLSNPARKNVAEVLLDSGNSEQATKPAQLILENSFPGSSEWLEAIILLSKIKVSENKLNESISILTQGIEQTGHKLFWKQQLLYLKALSYEKNSNTTKALATYLLVIDSAPISQKGEQSWYWFEQAGFRAIELLEQQKRWAAAVAAAKRIAAGKGPRSKEAIKYAEITSLKHMLWDEETESKNE